MLWFPTKNYKWWKGHNVYGKAETVFYWHNCTTWGVNNVVHYRSNNRYCNKYGKVASNELKKNYLETCGYTDGVIGRHNLSKNLLSPYVKWHVGGWNPSHQ